MALLCSQAPPALRLTCNQSWITQPLRSSCFHRPPCYYELLRPWAPHRYSHPRRSATWISPLGIGATGSHVPHRSLDQIHATSMPDAAQAVNRYLLDSSRVNDFPPVLTPFLRFRHVISGSLAFVFLIHT